MRRTVRSVVAGVVAGALLVACGGSGQTEGQKQIEDLNKAINNLADSMRDGKAEIERTLASYDAVINNKDGDLLKHFKAFNKGLDNIEKRRADVKENGDALQTVADQFFATWEATITKMQSEDMQKRSKERMATTKKSFEQIDKWGDEGRAAYEPLMTTLRDHALYLSSDLNPAAAKSLEKDAVKVDGNAKNLLDIMDKFLAAADEYNKKIAMKSTPPAEPKEKAAE
jgi:hypothetical protein